MQHNRARYYEEKDILRSVFGYAIPNIKVIKELVQYSPIVEYGAGVGYWAHLIEKYGGNVRCCDINPPRPQWSNIMKVADQDMFLLNDTNTLMLIWPEYHTTMSHDILNRYTGSRLIYVGEDEGGCTGTDPFFEIIKTKWIEKDQMPIPTWNTVYDKVFIYERRV